MGVLGTLALGLVGSLIGGFLGHLLEGGGGVFSPAGLIGSIIGAVIALLILPIGPRPAPSLEERLVDHGRPRRSSERAPNPGWGMPYLGHSW